MQTGESFNNDILLHQRDIELAQQRYPRIHDMLVWPGMHEAFRPIDSKALDRKRKSQRIGLTGLGLGLVTLILASLDPYLQHWPAWRAVAVWVAGFGLALAFAALAYGSLVMRGASRDAWLLDRLMTERFRQLHFQWLIRRAGRIASPSKEPRDKLNSERELLLQTLTRDLEIRGSQAVQETKDDLAARKTWLVEADHSSAAKAANRDVLDQLYRAYVALRFDHQSVYAGKKLDEGHGIWPGSPAGRAARISEITIGLTAAALLVSVLALVATLLQGSDTLLAVLGAIGMLAALCTLALRVLDEGLRPRAEVARYRAYQAEVEELQQKFAATTDDDQRIALMERMEELSYRELRQFLADHMEASFSL